MIAGDLILQGANGVRLQAERIRARWPVDPKECWTRVDNLIYGDRLDAEFFVVALWRILQGVRYGDDHSATIDRETAEMLKQARKVVDRELPQVKTMRDVIDHIDAYGAHEGDLKAQDRTALVETGPMYQDDLPKPRISIGVTRYRPADGIPTPGTTGEPHDMEHSVIWIDDVEAIVRDHIDPLLCHMYGASSRWSHTFRVKH
jgi:hypothetical protein